MVFSARGRCIVRPDGRRRSIPDGDPIRVPVFGSSAMRTAVNPLRPFPPPAKGGEGKMNLETAIKSAIEYETRIRDVYRDAGDKIADPVGRTLFKSLGEDEQHHVDYLLDRLRQWEQYGHITFEALETTVPAVEAFTRSVTGLEDRMAEDDRTDAPAADDR